MVQVLAIGVEHLQQQLQLQQAGMIIPAHAAPAGNALEVPGEQTSSLQVDTTQHDASAPGSGLQPSGKVDTAGLPGTMTTLSSDNPAQPLSLTGMGSMFSPNSPPAEFAREYKVMVTHGSCTAYGLLINLWQLVQGKASKAAYNSKIMLTDDNFQVTQPRTVLAGAAFCRKVGKDNGHWLKLVTLAEPVQGLAVGAKVTYVSELCYCFLSEPCRQYCMYMHRLKHSSTFESSSMFQPQNKTYVLSWLPCMAGCFVCMIVLYVASHLHARHRNPSQRLPKCPCPFTECVYIPALAAH